MSAVTVFVDTNKLITALRPIYYSKPGLPLGTFLAAGAAPLLGQFVAEPLCDAFGPEANLLADPVRASQSIELRLQLRGSARAHLREALWEALSLHKRHTRRQQQSKQKPLTHFCPLPRLLAARLYSLLYTR